MGISDGLLEVVAGQRARDGLDVGVAGLAQCLTGDRMDPFQQQEAYAVFRQRQSGHRGPYQDAGPRVGQDADGESSPWWTGGRCKDRTCDLRNVTAALSQLS